MALLGFDGFDYNNSGANLLAMIRPSGFKPWVSNVLSPTNWVSVSGLTAGQAIRTNNSGSNFISFFGLNGVTNAATLITGFQFKVHLHSGAVIPIMRFSEGGTALTAQCYLYMNSSRQVYLVANGSTLATGTTVLAIDGVYYIEVKVTFKADTTGSFEVRINGVNEISGSGFRTTTTANEYGQSVGFGPCPANNEFYYDNMYLCDGTGAAPTNDFLYTSNQGLLVETVYPVANDSIMFTPLSGAAYTQVDDTTEDDDTTYNASTAANDIDLFLHTGMSSAPLKTFGVISVAAMRKRETIPQNGRTKLVSGATTQNGDTISLTTSYQHIADMYLTDPNTGLAWNEITLDALKIGYEHL